jgi:hypothetical protein
VDAVPALIDENASSGATAMGDDEYPGDAMANWRQSLVASTVTGRTSAAV